ncbi:MAG: ATP-binding protein [Planctomycetaceae bacterium]|nr:ATP-binding protein [Planctomycetaceae bacterium]
MFTEALLLILMTPFDAAGATTGEIVACDFVFPTFAETILFSAEWFTNLGTWASIIGLVIAVILAVIGAIRWYIKKIRDQQKRIILKLESPEPVKKDPNCVTDTTALSPVSFEFITRDGELKKIRQHIVANKKIVVHGIGGIGKTEIARNIYAQGLAGKIDTVKKVGWIDYDGDLKSSFRKSFPKVGLDSDKTDEYHRKVLDHIKGFGLELLLLIDNVNTFMPETIRDIRSLPCKVILTSRQEIDGMENVLIDVATKDQCRKLYKEYSKAKGMPPAVLDEIIELAARHTLAIELLAKTQRAGGKKAEEFLVALKKSGFALNEVKVTVDHNQTDERFIEHFAKVFNLAGFESDTGLARYSVFRVLRDTFLSLLAFCGVRSATLRR